jgi:CDP-diacylglycerol--glycerol-3-phosphate 3-phosphatidyltransferase
MTAEQREEGSIVNVPNTLCAIRLLGSFVLVYLALMQREKPFIWTFVFLVSTDWIDGKLAMLLNQRTKFGARLDSAADATLYTALLFGVCWLKWDFLLANFTWIVAGLLSYAITCVAGLVKFGRIPSYHSYAAKTSWHLVNIAALCLFAGWAEWPVYVAAVAVVLTNLEATGITFALPEWDVDVRSLVHARRRQAAHRQESS